jgi:hypothetical protein
MLEISTSGLTSGDGKRSGPFRAQPPRPSSTLLTMSFVHGGRAGAAFHRGSRPKESFIARDSAPGCNFLGRGGEVWPAVERALPAPTCPSPANTSRPSHCHGSMNKPHRVLFQTMMSIIHQCWGSMYVYHHVIASMIWILRKCVDDHRTG